MIKLFLFLTVLFVGFQSQAAIEKPLPIHLTDEEKPLLKGYIEQASQKRSASPAGAIHSLGEWEDAAAAMTLWQNPSLVRAFTENGRTRIIADNESDQRQWERWLAREKMNSSQVDFFIARTDSLWIRDYGPWWIVSDDGIGIVDTVYNRPRPSDDVIPEFIGRELNIPVYKPGIVHTGGNYYSDGYGNAFSSSLIFRENNNFSVNETLKRMFQFLGITNYVTSPLGEHITIEHLDTFGKLVAPDTWVFSKFPENSRFYQDAERMVKLLETQTSAYGTPYKIFRLSMVPIAGEEYRAFINSFISNDTLYFPGRGDQHDEMAKRVYQQALPGYNIVSVSDMGTRWGDSVHCRTRNLIDPNTIFIFPKIVQSTGSQVSFEAKVIPSPSATTSKVDAIFVSQDGEETVVSMESKDGMTFSANQFLNKSSNRKFYIRATDSAGITKTHPRLAPQMLVEF